MLSRQDISKAARAGIHRLRGNGVRQPPSKPPPPEYTYQWVNEVLFPRVLAQGGRALRPHFAWGVAHAANLAKALGVPRISTLELGVAGGKGLISLERVGETIESISGVGIEVHGFDTGEGLPAPEDHRDLPNIYAQGRHPMDVDKLKSRLHSAHLHLGRVEDTIQEFVRSTAAPVGFVAVDLDLYTSTRRALRLFESNQAILLPRVHCYFDDIMGITCGDHNGERLAISDFNTDNPLRKISPLYGLKHFVPKPYRDKMWTDMYFMAHIFDHDLYNRDDGLAPNYDLSLEEASEDDTRAG